MNIRLILAILLSFYLFGCDDKEFGETKDSEMKLDSSGILDIHFIYNIQGIPSGKIKRADLSLAYTADSMYRGEFFSAINVSDAISKYRFYLPPGTYYYHATIICLAGGDSCKYVQFDGGQFGLRMDGGKVELLANKTTEVTTQFH
ncbi:MAG: hypothetical protein KAH17_08080 [Bacteroidales bacterium]|nr:hypothetical protein [Bacteroidales bacterium]